MVRFALLGSAVGLVAFAGAAGAQEFGPGMDWTGGYVGGNVSYTASDSNAAFVTAPFLGIPIASNPAGFAVSAFGGVNQQYGSLVFGAEGEIGYANITETRPDPAIDAFAVGVPAAAGDTVTTGSDFHAGLRGRLGFAADNFMPYITGGVVAAHLKTSFTAGGGGSDSGLGLGWAAGIGIEAALDESWSLRAEYLHINLSAPNFYEGTVYESSSNPVSNSLRLGLAYRY